jgi:gliding motility-associated-like protein
MSTSQINIISPVPGTTIHWNNNNPSIGLQESGSGNVPAFVAINRSNAPIVAVITVFGESAMGCRQAIKTFKIVVNPTPNTTVSNNLKICKGSVGQLSASGADQFIWSPSNGLSCLNCSNTNTSATNNITYYVQGINVTGCTNRDSVLVTVIQPFDMIVGPNDSICPGNSLRLKAMRANRYEWSPAVSLNNANIAEPIAFPTSNTRYQVVGFDNDHCFTDTGYVYVAVGTTPIVNIGPDINEAVGSVLELNSNTQNGTITNYQWSPSTNLSCDNCPNPNVTITGNTTYTLTVTNKFGCKSTDTLNIISFCKSAEVFVANAFSPDGDGINDLLIVRGKGITVKSFRIFNRWGNLVHEKLAFAPNDPKYGWDGKVKGIPAAPDVYVVVVEVTCDSGNKYIYKGNVTILK